MTKTHTFITSTATNWGNGPDEQRTWTLTEGHWSKVFSLSANSYWHPTDKAPEGRVERIATICAQSDDGDTMFFDDVEHFKRFYTHNMRGTVTPVTS